MKKSIKQSLEKIILGSVLILVGVGITGDGPLNNSFYFTKKNPVKNQNNESSSASQKSEKITAVVLEENPKNIMAQFGDERDENYVLKTRDYVGRIRYLVILDAQNKTKHELNKEIKNGCTIEFPSKAIGYETPFYTGKDRVDYIRIGYKYADRIKIVSKLPVPKNYYKTHPKEHIKVRLHDFLRYGR